MCLHIRCVFLFGIWDASQEQHKYILRCTAIMDRITKSLQMAAGTHTPVTKATETCGCWFVTAGDKAKWARPYHITHKPVSDDRDRRQCVCKKAVGWGNTTRPMCVVHFHVDQLTCRSVDFIRIRQRILSPAVPSSNPTGHMGG